MGQTTSTAEQLNLLDANLRALSRRCARAAESISAARLPPGATSLVARDGEPTFAWNDDRGRIQWHGRCATPTLRAQALIDAFQHGGRNILLVGAGQGAEIRLILHRILAHQAVFVLEDDPAVLALVLRLFDFRKFLAEGRLIFCTAPDPWQSLRAFLTENPGYLLPERLLAWPWFESNTAASLSDRVSSLNTAIAHDRAARLAAPANPAAPVCFTIHATAFHNAIRQTADRISIAAQVLETPIARFLSNDPALVHPAAVNRAIHECSPRTCLLLDCLPSDFAYQLPRDASVTTLMLDDDLSRDEALLESAPSLRIAVSSPRALTRLKRLGIDSNRLILCPPAATMGLDSPHDHPRNAVALVADLVDDSASAAGLHLASHERLWTMARKLILARIDSYRDEHADEILARAEKSAGCPIDSNEVRSGLVDRIRHLLGPTLVQRAYLQALAHAGIPFEFFGRITPADADFIRCHRGAWPLPADLPETFNRIGLLVTIETSGAVRPWLLDALAAGAACLVRAHPTDETKDGLASICNPRLHLTRFDSRNEMVRAIRNVLDHPVDFFRVAASAAAHVNASHTWRTRLEQLLHFSASSDRAAP